MTIRASFEAPGIRPPWLSRRVAAGIQWSIGLVLDAQWELVKQGIKARMPGVGTPDALAHIGNDRQIDRGPTESSASYATRLSAAFDTWRGAGNAQKLLEQLRAYFLPLPPAIRVVSNASVWHTIDAVTGIVTRTKPSVANWVWDLFAPSLAGGAPRWWRGWAIIDSSAGPWAPWFVGTSGRRVGDPDLTVGSTATPNEITSIRRIVNRWKPAHVNAMHIILTFDPTLFVASNAPGAPMPSGDYATAAGRSANACYWKGEV